MIQELPIDYAKTHVTARSRKHVLEIAAQMLAEKELSITERQIFEGFMERERLGSTNIGNGIAIPHCRLDCNSIRSAFLVLPKSIDYDDSEYGPVDMLFALIVPVSENDLHLKYIAKLSEVFSKNKNREQLRSASSDMTLNGLITQLLSSES